MKWNEYPFTNIIGEQSLRIKPEGYDFEIIATASGVRLYGESPWFSDMEALGELAKNIAKAVKFYEHKMREKHGLKAKPEEKPKKIITGDTHAI